MMKKWIFLLCLPFWLALGTAASAQAIESISCIDQSGAWKVNFNLEGKIVTNLQFHFIDELRASYPPIKAVVNQTRTKIFYDINFNQLSYFDFWRKKGSKQLFGGFLILESPEGMEVSVSCGSRSI